MSFSLIIEFLMV